MPLGKSLAHPLYLSLQLLQVRFELGHPLLAVAEAPMEAVGALPASATAVTMVAVTRTGVSASVVVTFVASAATGIIAAGGMATVTGAGAPAALMVTSVASAAAATILWVVLASTHCAPSRLNRSPNDIGGVLRHRPTDIGGGE